MPEPSYPSGITTGPDGNLWLAVGSPNAQPFIAKVGIDGTELAEYALPASAGQPRGIVAGPDGAIWFTEQGGIGRVTTTGKLSEFSLNDGGVAPFQIAVGPDKNLWFIEDLSGDGRVGRLTPSGQLTEFETPGVAGLQGITNGPDNALWFTGYRSDSIGRISLSGIVTSYPIPDLSSRPLGITTGADGNIWFTEVSSDQIDRLSTFAVSG